MCELFAMSSRQPATVTLSLDELCRRGGGTGPHRDGWGIAYFDGADVQVIREPSAAADSEWVRFVKNAGRRSSRVISHIRLATRGPRTLANTQPFARELGGRMHVFAHNGMLSGIDGHPELPVGRHRPIGTTDSELAFCALLARLEGVWGVASQPPGVSERLAAVAEFARALDPLGPANFVYSDGELAFAHGNRRTQSSGDVAPPGMWWLCRSCAREPGSGEAVSVDSDPGSQQVALMASVPLTDEAWTPLQEGETLVFSAGAVVGRHTPGHNDT